MSGARVENYVAHMAQAATDALGFVAGMEKAQFLGDKRTQQAVLMNLVIVGEAAARIIEQHPEFAERHPQVPWRQMRAESVDSWLFCNRPERCVGYRATGFA